MELNPVGLYFIVQTLTVFLPLVLLNWTLLPATSMCAQMVPVGSLLPNRKFRQYRPLSHTQLILYWPRVVLPLPVPLALIFALPKSPLRDFPTTMFMKSASVLIRFQFSAVASVALTKSVDAATITVASLIIFLQSLSNFPKKYKYCTARGELSTWPPALGFTSGWTITHPNYRTADQALERHPCTDWTTSRYHHSGSRSVRRFVR